MRYIFFLGPLFILILSSCDFKQHTNKDQEVMEEKKENIAFIGTYTKKEDHVDGQANGIYSISEEPGTGNLKFGETVARMENPSYLITSSNNKNLYAVSEIGEDDAPNGFVYSFKIDENNRLQELGKISTEGFAPCYVTEDRSGKFVFVANYQGGVVMMYKKDGDGNLEKLQKITLENPEGSHPHSVNITADNKFVYIPDLGNDKVWIFQLDEEGESLVAHEKEYIEAAKDSGPRHLSFSSSGKFAYVITEFSSTIQVFEIREDGSLESLQTISTIPEDFSEENTAADVHLHPSGRFLYASNRGHNSIATFRINEKDGKLEMKGHTPSGGEAPRNFSLAPGGDYLYVANQDSNNIVSLKLNPETGIPEPTGKDLTIKTPVCIHFKN